MSGGLGVSSKRARIEMSGKSVGTAVAFRRTANRPLDKVIVSANNTSVGATTQFNQQLILATNPCTVTGFRWSIHWNNRDAGNAAKVIWALIIKREGLTVSPLTCAAGQKLYAPEENVLAWGTAFLVESGVSSASHQFWEGDTKTQRKLMAGDEIVLAYRNDSASTDCYFLGTVQAICRF